MKEKKITMKKYFNIAGPCRPDDHYMISMQERLSGVMDLINQKQYFIIHAARQSGKTTLLLDLLKSINTQGKYFALYCSLETLQNVNKPDKGIPAIIKLLQREIKVNPKLKELKLDVSVDPSEYTLALLTFLQELCSHTKKPIIILFDEVDCLSNGTLLSFLRQLREGYIKRSYISFVHSIALVGMRNIRDYKANLRDDSTTLGSASPFNIISESLTLENFSADEIESLYDQHTKSTTQKFDKKTIEKIYHWTQGQPWLVNALAREIIVKILKNNYALNITPVMVDNAAKTIILRRDTHIDSLLERLKEPRVRKIIEPIILGDELGINRLDDDFEYVKDLGLISVSNGNISPSNQIYNEVIIRALTFNAQEALKSEKFNFKSSTTILENKSIDMNLLLTEFQQFWRINSEIWEDKFQYKEAAPHLILMAFLQRVLNGGGNIIREFGSGKGRVDLCIEYFSQKYPIELKLYYRKETITKGLEQLLGYMDRLGEKEGWLVIFDRRKKRSWTQKIYWKSKMLNSKKIHVVGC